MIIYIKDVTTSKKVKEFRSMLKEKYGTGRELYLGNGMAKLDVYDKTGMSRLQMHNRDIKVCEGWMKNDGNNS
jgi:hypothetical protein